MADTQTREWDRPVRLAQREGIKPQLVFAWIRANKLEVRDCECGHNLVKTESFDALMQERKDKAAEKQAKLEAELATATEPEAVNA